MTFQMQIFKLKSVWLRVRSVAMMLMKDLGCPDDRATASNAAETDFVLADKLVREVYYTYFISHRSSLHKKHVCGGALSRVAYLASYLPPLHQLQNADQNASSFSRKKTGWSLHGSCRQGEDCLHWLLQPYSTVAIQDMNGFAVKVLQLESRQTPDSFSSH